MAASVVRLLRVVAGGQRFCLPFDAVTGIERETKASAPSLAAWLGLPEDYEARQVIYTRVAGDALALAVESAGGARNAAVLPLTPVENPAGSCAPFAGLALFDDGPALALDLEAIARPAVAPPATEAWKVTEGEPVLVCRPGNVALRGRAVAVGLPLSSVLAVCEVPALVPLPSCPPPITGAAVFGEQAVPVIDVAAALGLPPREAPKRMVVFRGRTGPLGLLVEAADRIERTMHWAAPACLAPLCSPALVGAIPSAALWVAVLAPDRLLATPLVAHPAA